ncbi:uncharacterized protein TNCV_1929981 [Trichonephila clavipes]|nr:uncharacterized protein TNCV_1929981 [Trichonephila clavipes]
MVGNKTLSSKSYHPRRIVCLTLGGRFFRSWRRSHNGEGLLCLEEGGLTSERTVEESKRSLVLESEALNCFGPEEMKYLRQKAGVSPLLSIGWWYLSLVSPKRHCCRVSAADKGFRVYPLDPRPGAVVLYSGCTPGKHRAWFLPDDRHTASLVGLRGGWRHARTKMFTRIYGSMLLCSGKIFVLPNLNVDDIARDTRFLIVSLPNNDMSKKSPFAIHKTLTEKGGEPKSVKRLRSGDLLIKTSSALQTKSLLHTTYFLDSPANITPHKSLNSSRGVISEPDLFTTSEAEILEGFSNQCVIQTNILPSASLSSIKPTTQIESRLPEPISSDAAPDNSLNTSASSLSA